ncbi:phosphate:acyl-[acyl carrier protein] acyltransferase [Desulforamulus reducens MI-1]|uniref:Phosphate acyltransferase n=1 Tax=Desulforamulus reducens (strain ATCC BAA-1160 / DSM 100696 / MI-1) TaxID=349161 RepID=PLSX_DESRM|nr:RecName: Full=Phosphate acyltransferase; AltName: Full=Acyl-ACP phosphotransacylase; AltName: Full=Acyl-[acyl-carrier-protein]--phosphate acyltransferase; AltName: Full=Phosphate-acyl-ACP acyltransferase [Desulforamulus reducens MI-1]ABO50593.1 phosphate:acyl-[acyl carrier protein] acyltransferase [Desulforamulus reducens MI-1]
MIKIALDAMGGDHAPMEIIRGARDAAQELGVHILLVGDQEKIQKELDGDEAGGLISIVHAPEVVGMEEHPVSAIRKKKNSSIVVATQLVKEGVADAVVSAGSTGAQMASSLFILGRISGVDRPAISTLLPTAKGVVVLLDAGANVDCRPKHLKQFAVMGSLYAERVLGLPSPKVGLVNIGAEETKGNELTIASYQMLQKTSINFVGNVEGRDLFLGGSDVAVCDGFVGNVILKSAEGLAMSILGMFKQELGRLEDIIGNERIMHMLGSFKRRMDYAEYGGAPLLGVNGVSVICHGSSRARAIKNALRVAKETVEQGLVPAIKESLENDKGVEE